MRCILDVLGEYSRDRDQADRSADSIHSVMSAIAEQGIDSSISIKASTLGAVFDKPSCTERISKICERAVELGVEVEIDMEARGLLDYTLYTAESLVDSGFAITLAVQAYLDRTPADLEQLISAGMRIRLVKGAYSGDSNDYVDIQGRFRACAEIIGHQGIVFCAGTHDPELINWLKDEYIQSRHVEFGFLKGLSDETKTTLVKDGRMVAEYVPFGGPAESYVARRTNYLKKLKELGKEPAP